MVCVALFKHLLFSFKHRLRIVRRSRAVLAEISSRTEVRGAASVQ